MQMKNSHFNFNFNNSTIYWIKNGIKLSLLFIWIKIWWTVSFPIRIWLHWIPVSWFCFRGCCLIVDALQKWFKQIFVYFIGLIRFLGQQFTRFVRWNNFIIRIFSDNFGMLFSRLVIWASVSFSFVNSWHYLESELFFRTKESNQNHRSTKFHNVLIF